MSTVRLIAITGTVAIITDVPRSVLAGNEEQEWSFRAALA
jgi:hypothetical protein